MQFNSDAINSDLFWILADDMPAHMKCSAHNEWCRLLREARQGWVFSNSKHEVLMFPDEIACAVRRFLDICARPRRDFSPSYVSGVGAEAIRRVCLLVWGVPFYAGRGALTLCEPEPVRGALTVSAAGALEVMP